MKRLNIIVNNVLSWRVHWDQFKKNIEDYNVLIVDEESFIKIAYSGDHPFIDKIVMIEDAGFDYFNYGSLKLITGFNKEKLKQTVLSVINEFNTQVSLQQYLLNIVTICEDDLINCSDIQHEILSNHLFEQIYVGENFIEAGLQAIQAMQFFKNKEKMKQVLSLSLQAYMPKFIVYNKEIPHQEPLLHQIEKAQLKYPLFVKPIDSCNSRGVYVLSNHHDLEEWLEILKTSDIIYEIDEYIQGKLYHCDSIINEQGDIVHSFISEYLNPCASYYVENLAFSGSLILYEGSPFYDDIQSFNQKVIQALAPKNCVTHHEFFIDHSGNIKFIEIAKRAAGALITELYECQFSVNLRDIDVQLRLELIQANSIKIRTSPTHYARLEFLDTVVNQAHLENDLKLYKSIKIIHTDISLQYELTHESKGQNLVDLILECPNYSDLESFLKKLEPIKSSVDPSHHIKPKRSVYAHSQN